MKRRQFLTAATVGAAATTLAAPAIAQNVIRWRLVSAWPRNLPGPGVAAQNARRPHHHAVGRPGSRSSSSQPARSCRAPACSTPSVKARPKSTTRAGLLGLEVQGHPPVRLAAAGPQTRSNSMAGCCMAAARKLYR